MKRICRSCGVLLLCGAVSGCAIIGAVAYKAAPGPTVPAEYKPPRQPTLVMVENYQNPAAMEVPAERLDREIAQLLSEHKVVPMVDPQQLFDLRDRKGQSFARMDIPAVAREVGARQVVYVDLLEFSADPPAGSDVVKGEARAMVKVVDVSTGRTLWPQDSSAGREIHFQTPVLRPEAGASVQEVQEQLYTKLGERVARLFYAWESDKVDGSEPDMSSALR